MKTGILTVITMLTLVVASSKTTKAATVADNATTVLTDVQSINKIEIRGNVELYISNGNTDNIKVYNKYYSESALVQNQNGVLRISSYKNQKLVVWVTAKDLRSINAYDNSSVKSFGALSGIELNVNLYNTAVADLNMDAFRANIKVNNTAKANLTGNAVNCDLQYNQSASVNSAGLVAANISRTVDRDYYVTKNTDQVAGL